MNHSVLTFDKPRFVQRVRMDVRLQVIPKGKAKRNHQPPASLYNHTKKKKGLHLNIILIRHFQTTINVAGRCAPILMELQTASASADRVPQTVFAGIVAFRGEGVVEREAVCRQPI